MSELIIDTFLKYMMRNYFIKFNELTPYQRNMLRMTILSNVTLDINRFLQNYLKGD